MKKSLFTLFLVLATVCSGSSIAWSADRYPAADGHYYFYDIYGCSQGSPCTGDNCDPDPSGPYTEINSGILLARLCTTLQCGMWACYYSLIDKYGIVEFDISGLGALFSTEEITATLILTVKNGSGTTGAVTLHNIQDAYENGVIESEDVYGGESIQTKSSYLAPGTTIKFNVTDAVSHDLFDAGQSDITGFYLTIDDNQVEFYDHTHPSYAPLLKIQTYLSDGAYYPFNGNSVDESGNGHDADVNTAALAPDQFSNPDQAYHFDGTDDIIRIDNASAFNNSAVSIAAWIKPETDPTASAWPRIVDKYDWGLWQGYSLLINSATGKARFSILTEDGLEHYVDTSTTITPGQWQHLACTFDGSALRIYYNGQEEATAPANSPINHTDGPLSIGNVYYNGNYYPFAGTIDEVHIYGEALMQLQIEQFISDSDSDGISEDGDNSGVAGDNPCTGGATESCDDNCPGLYTPEQVDTDADGIGEACDSCPGDPDNDIDGDGICGDVDPCPNDSYHGPDSDADQIPDNCDNCIGVANTDQLDSDGDGIGDACDDDTLPEIQSVTINQGPDQTSIPLENGTAFCDGSQNVIWTSRDPGYPGDGLGWASRMGIDHTYISYKLTTDTVWSSDQETVLYGNPGFYGQWSWIYPTSLLGADGNYDIRLAAEDAAGNRSEVTYQITIGTTDTDGDDVPDCIDNCPSVCNPIQQDADGDGLGDLCDVGPGCGPGGCTPCEEPCPAP